MSLKTSPTYRIKLAADTKTGRISGYGSVVGNPDSYGDIVSPGAFATSLRKHQKDGTRPAMLWAHRPGEPVGRWNELKEDSTGLFLVGDINLESSWGRDAWAAVEGGDVDGLSIGYREITARPDGIYRRLDELDLVEVSIVTFPANPKARIRLSGKRDLEELLTKAGLPKNAAAKVAAGGWDALSPGDADDDEEAAARALLAAVKTSTERIRTSK